MSAFWEQVLSVAFLVGVIGNLTAAALGVLPALLGIHRKLDRQHAERLGQASRHHQRILLEIRKARHNDHPSPEDPGRPLL